MGRVPRRLGAPSRRVRTTPPASAARTRLENRDTGLVVDGWIGALALQGVFDESAVDQGRIVRICHIRRPWNWLASRWRTNRSYIVTRWQPFSRLPAVAAGHAAMVRAQEAACQPIESHTADPHSREIAKEKPRRSGVFRGACPSTLPLRGEAQSLPRT